MSGPLVDAKENTAEAQLVFKVENREVLQKLIEQDPYWTEGLVAEHTIREWNPMFGKLGYSAWNLSRSRALRARMSVPHVMCIGHTWAIFRISGAVWAFWILRSPSSLSMPILAYSCLKSLIPANKFAYLKNISYLCSRFRHCTIDTST